MAKTGSYMYIRGTNIEVGIRRVSSDPENPYAQCVFRHGTLIWPRGKSSVNTIKHVIQKIPICCLTSTPDFDIRRGRLKKDFKHSVLEYAMPDKEGLFHTQTDPHLYDIFPCGKKFFHIMKGPTKEHIAPDEKPRQLSIYGMIGLTFPVKFFENDIVTFNTRPVRMAHVSVVRKKHTMAFLGKHSSRWPYPTKLEFGFIKGSWIAVSTVIQHDDISLYKLRSNKTKIIWLPNSLIVSRGPHLKHKASTLKDLAPIPNIEHVYINGLPTPFKPYARKELVHKGLSHEHIFAVLGDDIYLVATKHITLEPKREYEYLLQYRYTERLEWKADNERRMQDMRRRLRPIAVA